jgi:hypothetical protein
MKIFVLYRNTTEGPVACCATMTSIQISMGVRKRCRRSIAQKPAWRSWIKSCNFEVTSKKDEPMQPFPLRQRVVHRIRHDTRPLQAGRRRRALPPDLAVWAVDAWDCEAWTATRPQGWRRESRVGRRRMATVVQSREPEMGGFQSRFFVWILNLR